MSVSEIRQKRTEFEHSFQEIVLSYDTKIVIIKNNHLENIKVPVGFNPWIELGGYRLVSNQLQKQPHLEGIGR